MKGFEFGLDPDASHPRFDHVEHRQEAVMNKRLFPLLMLPALLLAACAGDVLGLLSDEGNRARVIDALAGDPSMRAEVVDRLLSRPDDRTAMFERLLASDDSLGAFIEQMVASERGQAVAATRIAAEKETARTFIGMMALTGGVGEVLDQQQAECLGLGDALAHGNQKRTMVDLKRLGEVVEAWARDNDGAYPVCEGFRAAADCLASSLPTGALAEIRLNDAWGRPILYHSDDAGTTYALISYATDGQHDGLGKAGPTSSYNADIVFADGDFAQWPGQIVKDTIQ
jgi:hypothetical protein